ncbi:MAG: tripartite tricarboxylate transporter TctB family protein [Oscillospiraceae bacterium]|nr:tripartite tricarboxylate transporter TctB family protein [Oscillospiraceae bacterium]
MKNGQATRDLISGIVLLFINVFLYTQIAQIRWGNDEFVYSAAFMPMVSNILLSVLTVALIVRSLIKGGRLHFGELGASIKNGVKVKEFRAIAIAIVTILLLIFVAMPLLGFWIAGALYMLFILLFFVKTFKPLVSVIFTAVSMAVMYVVFIVVFRVPI